MGTWTPWGAGTVVNTEISILYWVEVEVPPNNVKRCPTMTRGLCPRPQYHVGFGVYRAHRV